MKKLLVSLLTLASFQTSAFATNSKSDINLKDGDISVSYVQSAEIVSVQTVYPRPHCPANVMCAAVMPQPELHIVVNFHLNGCLDHLGPVTSTFDYSENAYTHKNKLIISAVNISNKTSLVARCIVANTALMTIVVGSPRADFDIQDIELQLLK